MTGKEEGTIRGVDFERWEDDGSEEFEAGVSEDEGGVGGEGSKGHRLESRGLPPILLCR